MGMFLIPKFLFLKEAIFSSISLHFPLVEHVSLHLAINEILFDLDLTILVVIDLLTVLHALLVVVIVADLAILIIPYLLTMLLALLIVIVLPDLTILVVAELLAM